MTEKIITLLKEGDIKIPKFFFMNYKKLQINEKELVLLIYLLNNSEFNPSKMSEELGFKLNEILKLVDSLSKKDLIKLDVVTKNGIKEECFNTDELYNKLALLLINETNDKEKPATIYDEFEKEFGRTLSPMEYEIIGAWLESGILEETIRKALKEAIYNGVTNLRYIDKIIFDWKKKGPKEEKKEKKEELFEYDWLNE